MTLVLVILVCYGILDTHDYYVGCCRLDKSLHAMSSSGFWINLVESTQLVERHLEIEKRTLEKSRKVVVRSFNRDERTHLKNEFNIEY